MLQSATNEFLWAADMMPFIEFKEIDGKMFQSAQREFRLAMLPFFYIAYELNEFDSKKLQSTTKEFFWAAAMMPFIEFKEIDGKMFQSSTKEFLLSMLPFFYIAYELNEFDSKNLQSTTKAFFL